RLGAQVTMVGRVGRDVFGDGMTRTLTRQGIDTSFIKEDVKEPSGTAAIVGDDEARNCILVVPGANGMLSADDGRAAEAAIRPARALLCQLGVPTQAPLEAFPVARAAGVKTILNPAPAAPLSDEMLSLIDMCVPNETELELLTGRSIHGMDQVETAARTIIQRGPPTVLVTLGARGVLVVTEKTAEHIPAVPVEAVDPTGAGDAFIGALAVFLAEGRSLVEAVRWANAAAGLSVMRHGAQASFPTRDEVEGLFLGER